MWTFRKKKQDLPKKTTTIETLKCPDTESYHVGPVFAPLPPSLNIANESEDNDPVCRELRLPLSLSDWKKLEKEPFYSQLKQWVCSLENSDIPESSFQLDEEEGLSEVELYTT